MRTALVAALAIVLSALVPTSSSAGQLRMEFADGYVTISATDVSVRQLLTEWARLGGTKVVNLEKLSGAPLTIELAHVPEKQALEVVLRSLPGYVVAPRPAPMPGSSQFDRIIVMPGTVAPPVRTAAAPAPAPPPQLVAPPPMPNAVVEDQDQPVPEAPEQAAPVEQEQRPPTLPQPGFQPMPPGQPGAPPPAPGPAGPVISPTPGQLPLPPQKPPQEQQEQ